MPSRSIVLTLIILLLGASSAMAQYGFSIPFEFCPGQGLTDVISFQLQEEGPVILVVEHVFTNLPVRTLVMGFLPAGAHSIVWDGLDDEGQLLDTGVYVFRLMGDGWEVEEWSTLDCGLDAAIQSRVVVGGRDVTMGFANVIPVPEPTELAVYTSDGSTRVRDFSDIAHSRYTFFYWGFEDSAGQVLPAGDYIYRMASPSYSEDIAFTIDPIERGSLAMTVTGADGHVVTGLFGAGETPLVKGPLQQMEIDFGRAMSAAELAYLLDGGLEFSGAFVWAQPESYSVQADSTGVIFHGFALSRSWPDVWGFGAVGSYGMFDPYSSRVQLGFDHEGITGRRALCQPAGGTDPTDWVVSHGPFYFSPAGTMAPPCNNPIPPGERAELQFSTDAAGMVVMIIIDRQGNLVRQLIFDYSWEGPKVEFWDRLDNAGNEVPEGIYHLIWTAQGQDGGSVVTSGDIYVSNAVSDVPQSGGDLMLPSLGFNHPNPFNPSTAISFDLPVSCFAQVTVLSLDGKRVATLVAEAMESGHHSVTWNGRDQMGHRVPSGAYFYRLEADETVSTRRMLLLK